MAAPAAGSNPTFRTCARKASLGGLGKVKDVFIIVPVYRHDGPRQCFPVKNPCMSQCGGLLSVSRAGRGFATDDVIHNYLGLSHGIHAAHTMVAPFLL